MEWIRRKRGRGMERRTDGRREVEGEEEGKEGREKERERGLGKDA